MGNVNMEASQVHVRDNSHKTWGTVADAIKALDNQDTMVQEDITELYTRDSSRASKDDIALDFSAETNYYVGDIVYYEGTLFKCISNHNAGAWNPDDFAITSIASLLTNMSGGLSLYTETRAPIEDVTFSHTFMHAPKIILSIWEAEATLETPIIIGDSGIISTNFVVNNGGNQHVKVYGVTYNAETQTLSYTGANMDVSFNRSTNYITYLA